MTSRREDLARQYFDIRAKLYDELHGWPPVKIVGPAKILALVWKADKTYDFEFYALIPGQEFEGQFIAWNIGYYD
jgi:uncharacterized cupredoxin-like copper-binding protein